MAAHANNNPNVFLLPDLGEGLEEAELLEWCVKEGQDVKESEMVAKMETAKAVVEVYSPRAGTIEKLHGAAGETIKVHAPFITYKSAAGEAQAVAADNGKSEASEGHEVIEENVDHAFDVGLDEDREDAGTVVGMLGEADDAVLPGGEKVRAAPAVRRLARDLTVDITKVKGTGIGGRITSRDVQAQAAEMPPAITPKPPQPVRPTKPATAQSRPAAGVRWPSKQNGTGLPPRRIPM